MKLPWALILLVVAVQSAPGVDLTKIERTIAKEPAYQTKAPKYCLLVFGLEARTRAWLVIDGKTMYVDRNGDGDLTGADERVESVAKSDNAPTFRPGPITAEDGKSRYAVEVQVSEQGNIWMPVSVNADKVSYQAPQIGGQNGLLRFADRPGDAPILHFDGPLTIEVGRQQVKIVNGKNEPAASSGREFVRGDKPCDLPIMVGTPGLGKGTFTALLFRPGALPAAAEIVFPNRDPVGKPIVVKIALTPPT